MFFSVVSRFSECVAKKEIFCTFSDLVLAETWGQTRVQGPLESRGAWLKSGQAKVHQVRHESLWALGHKGECLCIMLSTVVTDGLVEKVMYWQNWRKCENKNGTKPADTGRKTFLAEEKASVKRWVRVCTSCRVWKRAPQVIFYKDHPSISHPACSFAMRPCRVSWTGGVYCPMSLNPARLWGCLNQKDMSEVSLCSVAVPSVALSWPGNLYFLSPLHLPSWCWLPSCHVLRNPSTRRGHSP